MTKLARAIGFMLKNARLAVCLFLVTLDILIMVLILRTLATGLLLSGSSVVIMANATTIFVSLPVLTLAICAGLVLRTLRTCLVRRTRLSFGSMFFVLGRLNNAVRINKKSNFINC